MPEQNSTKRREQRGLFILIALFILALLIFNLDVVADLARNRVELVAVMPEAEGVRSGSAVWVAGKEAGRVLAITLLPTSDTAKLAVRLRIDGSALEVIRADSELSAFQRRFIGEPIVYIAPGSPGAPTVGDGDTLYGRPAPAATTTSDLLAVTRALLPELESLRADGRRLQTLVQAREPDVAAVQRGLASVADESRALASLFEQGAIGRFANDPALQARIGGLRERVADLALAAESALARYHPDDGPLAPSLRSLARRAGRVTDEIDALEARLHAGPGFIPRFAEDPALAVAAEGVRLQIDSLMAEGWNLVPRMFLPGRR